MRVFPDELLLRNPAARCCAALKVPDILYFPEDDAERQRAQATRAAGPSGNIQTVKLNVCRPTRMKFSTEWMSTELNIP